MFECPVISTDNSLEKQEAKSADARSGAAKINNRQRTDITRVFSLIRHLGKYEINLNCTNVQPDIIDLSRVE